LKTLEERGCTSFANIPLSLSSLELENAVIFPNP